MEVGDSAMAQMRFDALTIRGWLLRDGDAAVARVSQAKFNKYHKR